MNEGLRAEFQPLYAELVNNIRTGIYHLKIAEKQHLVSSESLLLKPCFAQLPNGDYAACNGFVANNLDITLDIARPEAWNYLKRAVFPWKDCVKLRYGSKPTDSPALWAYMEAYVSAAALQFDGIRIDNAHGTPLHVLSHMVRVAKRLNPDIVVMAEVFASCEEQEKAFLLAGSELIIRESAHCHDCRDLADTLNATGSSPLPGVLYDCSHDNEMPRTYEALSRAAAVAFAKGPVGSTKGVDELLLNRVAVVGENREYPAVSQGDWGEYEGKTLLVLVYRSEECIERVEVKGEWDSWQTMTQLQ
jgi:glycogen debranching enzyme